MTKTIYIPEFDNGQAWSDHGHYIADYAFDTYEQAEQFIYEKGFTSKEERHDFYKVDGEDDSKYYEYFLEEDDVDYWDEYSHYSILEINLVTEENNG